MDNEKVMTAVKAWITPFLLIGIATILYDDISEMKTDIKVLLAQSSADAVKIEYLQQEVESLKNKVYTGNKPINNDEDDTDHSFEFIAILPSRSHDYTGKSVYRKL